VRQALTEAGLKGSDIASVGITNQRETVFVWDLSGVSLHNGIVWQDRRTAERCDQLAESNVKKHIEKLTGLRVDPYFSATKIEWLLQNVDGLKKKAENGEALFGTVESWLIWKLTNGEVHATDHTNASRTMLFDIHKKLWDEKLMEVFGVPPRSLPELRENISEYGVVTGLKPLEGVPIGAAFGDQQSSLFGQGCFEPGEVKNTYGTGSFLLVNTGEESSISENLLTTIGFSLNGEVKYALEGSIYSTGATIQWLRDSLGIIEDASETEKLAESLDGNEGVYLVPAFTGLGAPHWDSSARGTIVGLTRGNDEKHLARAALESIAFQVEDVLREMKQELNDEITELRVDGGGAKNNFLCQFQSDISSIPVVRAEINESTALGAAYGAGLASRLWKDFRELETMINKRKTQRFEPRMDDKRRDKLYLEWREAVERSKHWEK